MIEHTGKQFETKSRKGFAQDSAMKDSRRLPDIPWKYNPPAPDNVVRPKPVVVPKSK